MALVSGFNLHFTAKQGVTDDGAGNVTAWTDQVSGNKDITVPGTNVAPTLGATLNGHEIIQFNGSDTALQRADSAWDRQATAGNHTMIYLVIRSPFNESFGYVLDVESTFNRNACYLSDSPSVVARDGNDSINAASTVNEWLVVTLAFDRDQDGTGEVWIDGVSGATGILNSSGGTGFTLGMRGDGFGNGTFDIVEIVEYWDVTKHTQTEVDQNVSHLQSEWGLGGDTSISVSDSLALSDTFNNISVTLGVSDNLGLADQSDASVLIKLIESLNTSDQISDVNVNVDLSDSLALAEAEDVKVSFTVNESINFSDSVASVGKGDQTINVVDTISLVGSIVSVTNDISVSDVLNVADGILIDLNLPVKTEVKVTLPETKIVKYTNESQFQ